MNEKTYGQELKESLFAIFGFLAVIAILLVWSGAVTYTPDPAPAAIPVTIAPVITPEPVQTSTVEIIEPTPTPYTYQEFMPGWRKQGELFSWKREDVQGLKDMFVSTTVYGWKELPYYTWYSEQYQKEFPEYPEKGNKFIAIYVTQWMQGDSPDSDPSMWGFNWSHFALQYKGQAYRVDKYYEPSIRIQELQDTFNYDKITRITPYGYDIEYRPTSEARDNAGWIAIERQWLRMGFSLPNRWDGYILYQVPKNAAIDDIEVISDFDTFGYSTWQLDPDSAMTLYRPTDEQGTGTTPL